MGIQEESNESTREYNESGEEEGQELYDGATQGAGEDKAEFQRQTDCTEESFGKTKENEVIKRSFKDKQIVLRNHLVKIGRTVWPQSRIKWSQLRLFNNAEIMGI
uniref:Uncharacterized protein n=2 Tax=Cacopsylla melanoneura TaxID=428564 RepID=A0A8D8UHC6_9HEMI